MLNDSLLGGLIGAAIPNKLQAQFPDSIPMQFQIDLAMACAKGFVQNIKGVAKGVGAVGPPAAGFGIGISGISASNMVRYSMSKLESSGAAMKPILEAIFEPTVSHLALTQVISMTGFGGPLLKVTNLIPNLVAQDILAALPSQVRENLAKSRSGKALIEAIAFGFCQEITTIGVPGVIPAAGIPPGPVAAFFS